MEYYLIRKKGTDTFYKHDHEWHAHYKNNAAGYQVVNPYVDMADATIFKTIGGAKRTMRGRATFEIVRVEYEPMITGVID